MTYLIWILLVFFIMMPSHGQDLLDLSTQELSQLYSISPHYDVKEEYFTNEQKTFSQSQDTQAELKMGVRKSGQLILYATQNQLTLRITKQDLNWEKDEDLLQVNMLDNKDQVISTYTIPDDGTTEATLRRGPVQSYEYKIELPAPGIYHIFAEGNRDQVFFLDTNASGQAYRSTLELVEPSKPLTLYFKNPSEPFSLTLNPPHYTSLYQTVRLIAPNGEVVQEEEIRELSKKYTFQATPIRDPNDSLWKLEMEKQDFFIRSPQIKDWYFSPEDYFDFETITRLIQPNALSLYTIPRARMPLRFKSENITESTQHLRVEWEALSFESPVPAASTKAVTIPAASQAILTTHVDIPSDHLPGATYAYQINLFDEETSALLTSARAIIHVTTPPSLPTEQPYLFLTREKLSRIREKGRSGSFLMQNIHNNLLIWGDSIVDQNLPVPEEEGGWFNHYICDGVGDGDEDPDDGHGVSLLFDPTRPGFYICPIDGERYSGRRYERGWLGLYHFELARRLKQLGIAYALEPRDRYAQLARKMLLDYADRYKSWPLDDFQDRPSQQGARILTDTLSEASWLISALIAYDFTRHHDSYSIIDRAHIEYNLIRPAAQIIRNNPMGVTNWQSWHNTAMLFAGYILQDSDLIEEALHGKNGHDFIVEEAIREDGIWSEGSLGYHFYALIPMNLLLEALHTRGEDPFTSKIKQAYGSLLDLMHHDGTFPDLNDSTAHPIWHQIAHYEHANAHFSDERFDQILNFVYGKLGYKRSNMEALFFGEDYEELLPQFPSDVKREMGLSFLRPEHDLDEPMAIMDYGPQGLTHGHLDKLHLSFYGAGEVWLPDMGTGSVLFPEFTGWFRRTIGHNTIMVGERNQNEDTEESRAIDDFQSSIPKLQVMQASFGRPVYPEGSHVERRVVLIDRRYALLLDQITGAPTPYDIIFHSAGDLSSKEDFFPSDIENKWGQSAIGYQFLHPLRQYNDQIPSRILHHVSTQPLKIQANREYGLTDPLENLDIWSGNIGLATDCTQGRHALNWTIVPRESQDVEKRFHRLASYDLPDFLVFDYKIEASTFSRFLVEVNFPERMNAQWEITTGNDVQVGEWQTAEIDLTQPDHLIQHQFNFHKIQFLLTGAEENTEVFHIKLDNLRAKKNGERLSPEERGLHFLFPGGETTDYYLASGPSSSPPRVHPVIIARRNDVEATLHTTLLEPYMNKPAISSMASGTDYITFQSDEAHYEVSWDLAKKSYSFIKTTPSQREESLAMLNQSALASDNIVYKAEQATSFSVQTHHYDDSIWSLTYVKPNDHEDELNLRENQPPQHIFLDSNPVTSWTRKQTNEGRYEITIPDLPSGKHEITVILDAPTRISDWLQQQ